MSAPTAQVTGAGFAAKARWMGDEADTTASFDQAWVGRWAAV
ncbi:hypothetical protein [Prosthecobacter sp.]